MPPIEHADSEHNSMTDLHSTHVVLDWALTIIPCGLPLRGVLFRHLAWQNDFLHINRIRKLPGVVLRGFGIVEVLEDTIWSTNPQLTKILEADGILDNFCLLEDFVGHGIAGLLAEHSLVATDHSW
jgi:hypothetical protein